MTDWSEDELALGQRRWPMAPTHLLPRERWLWWERLWSDVLALGERYRIRPGKDWWEDGVQVERAGRARRLGRTLRLRRVG